MIFYYLWFLTCFYFKSRQMFIRTFFAVTKQVRYSKNYPALTTGRPPSCFVSNKVWQICQLWKFSLSHLLLTSAIIRYKMLHGSMFSYSYAVMRSQISYLNQDRAVMRTKNFKHWRRSNRFQQPKKIGIWKISYRCQLEPDLVRANKIFFGKVIQGAHLFEWQDFI